MRPVLILLFGAVCAAGLYFAFGQNQAFLVDRELAARLSPSPFELRDKALLRLGPERLEEVSFRGPGQDFSLVRQGESWQVEGRGRDKDVQGRADPFLVQEVVAALVRARAAEPLSATPPDRTALTLGLAFPEQKEWARLWPDQDREGLIPGRSSFQPEAFLVPAPELEDLNRPAGWFLDRRALVYDPGEAARLILIRKEEGRSLRLVVEKSPRGIWRVKEPDPAAPDGPEVDQAEVSALVVRLAGLRYLGPADRGFEKTVLTILLESGKGEVLAGLETGKAENGLVIGRILTGGIEGDCVSARDRRGLFVFEERVFGVLPGPWALTNKN